MINARQALLVLLIGCGLGFVLLAGTKNGHPFLYLSVAIALLVVCFSFILFLGFVSYRFFPSFPPCATGKCRGLFCYKSASSDGAAKRYKCECGIEYVMSDKRKLDLVQEGIVRPFMFKTWYGIWKPVSACPGGTKHE